jgi:hypothetical protein
VRAVTPAVILFQLVSSVIAFGRITLTSAFGFRGQEAELVLQKLASKHRTPTDFGALMEPSASNEAKRSVAPSLNNHSIFKHLIVVEPDGIEPTTSSMPLKRSPN